MKKLPGFSPFETICILSHPHGVVFFTYNAMDPLEKILKSV